MLLVSAAVLSVGLAIAYYNTASLGYDNANILTLTDESIRIFDITIIFDDVKEFIEKIANLSKFDFVVI